MLDELPPALLPPDAIAEDVLYVADAQLDVRFVNTAWRSFAEANNGKPLVAAGWNSRLLANFSGSERLRWQAIYDALLTGRLQTHEENFICPSPIERRMYRLRIRRHADDAGKTTWLSHHAVRVDGKNEASILGERLRALDDDEAGMVEAYKRLVPNRPVCSTRFATAQFIAPLHEVGGDFLWYHEWPDAGTDLVIADVMGHGQDAARLAAKIVLLLDACAEETLTVAQNVARLNCALYELVQRRKGSGRGPLFATGLYLRVDCALQSLVLCSFGHVGPIFSGSGHIQPPSGLPVGIVADEDAAAWQELELRFDKHGRRFAIFTDGLTEQFNIDGEMFGVAGIERALRLSGCGSLTQAVAALQAGIEAFRGNALVKDDQALLAVEVTAV